MAQIKNIIFDLGGVLLNIDYKRTSSAFKKLGVKNFDDLYSQFNANDLFENLETGAISESYFYNHLRQYCTAGTTDADIRMAWDAMLLSFRIETLSTLKTLKKNYKLFLLSNTNSIHITEFKKIFTRDTGKPCLNDYFDKTYYSHLIKMRKPYIETYQFVLKDAGIMAEETLFIEDSIQNIEGAKKAGIHTHFLLPSERIEDVAIF